MSEDDMKKRKEYIPKCKPGESLAEKMWRAAVSAGSTANEGLDAVAPDRQTKTAVVVGGTAAACAVLGAAAMEEWQAMSSIRMGASSPSTNGSSPSTPRGGRGTPPGSPAGRKAVWSSHGATSSANPPIFELLTKKERMERERAVMNEMVQSKIEAEAMGANGLKREPPGRYTRLTREASGADLKSFANESKVDRERRIMREMMVLTDEQEKNPNPDLMPWDKIEALPPSPKNTDDDNAMKMTVSSSDLLGDGSAANSVPVKGGQERHLQVKVEVSSDESTSSVGSDSEDSGSESSKKHRYSSANEDGPNEDSCDDSGSEDTSSEDTSSLDEQCPSPGESSYIDASLPEKSAVMPPPAVAKAQRAPTISQGGVGGLQALIDREDALLRRYHPDLAAKLDITPTTGTCGYAQKHAMLKSMSTKGVPPSVFDRPPAFPERERRSPRYRRPLEDGIGGLLNN